MYPYITYPQIAQLVLKPFLYSITVGRRELSIPARLYWEFFPAFFIFF